ncbi:MAG: hypothetical protein HY579_05970 [Nitrospinae bacterium]|nr:hypothetical protein [Nitrospinota bacterium]
MIWVFRRLGLVIGAFAVLLFAWILDPGGSLSSIDRNLLMKGLVFLAALLAAGYFIYTRLITGGKK